MPRLLGLELRVVLWLTLSLPHHIGESQHETGSQLVLIIDPDVPEAEIHYRLRTSGLLIDLSHILNLEIFILAVQLRSGINTIKATATLLLLVWLLLLILVKAKACLLWLIAISK